MLGRDSETKDTMQEAWPVCTLQSSVTYSKPVTGRAEGESRKERRPGSSGRAEEGQGDRTRTGRGFRLDTRCTWILSLGLTRADGTMGRAHFQAQGGQWDCFKPPPPAAARRGSTVEIGIVHHAHHGRGPCEIKALSMWPEGQTQPYAVAG